MNIKERITYIIADTTRHELSKYALSRSQEELELKNTIVFTDDRRGWNDAKVVIVDKFKSIADYNRVILHGIAEHLETDFCLIIQYDGFVLNGNLFSELFLNYDYIGATWPHFDLFNVGNGGFSLRSKSLVNIVANMVSHTGDFLAPEDVLICRHYRAILEDNFNIRFAAPAIANHFSQELIPQPWLTFGFHGAPTMPLAYRDDLEFMFEHLGEIDPLKYSQMSPTFERMGADAMSVFRRHLKK